jgi:hypothetical protein
MKALGSYAPDIFIRRIFSRVNPVLPPRRKARTAKRWAVAGAHCARLLHAHFMRDPLSDDSIHRWAARVVLNASPTIPAPPEWEGPAKLGGVERAALRKLAEFVVSTPDTHTDGDHLTAAAWRFLFPKTARIASESQFCRDAAEIEMMADQAISEWELLPDPGYTWIMTNEERLESLQPLVDALHFRAPEAGARIEEMKAGEVWHGDGASTIACLDDSPEERGYVITIDFGGAIIPAEIEAAIRMCDIDVDTESAPAGSDQPRYRGPAADLPPPWGN